MDAEPGGMTAVLADLLLTKTKQEKALALFCARTLHKCPQCGLFQGFATGDKRTLLGERRPL